MRLLNNLQTKLHTINFLQYYLTNLQFKLLRFFTKPINFIEILTYSVILLMRNSLATPKNPVTSYSRKELARIEDLAKFIVIRQKIYSDFTRARPNNSSSSLVKINCKTCKTPTLDARNLSQIKLFTQLGLTNKGCIQLSFFKFFISWLTQHNLPLFHYSLKEIHPILH